MNETQDPWPDQAVLHNAPNEYTGGAHVAEGHLGSEAKANTTHPKGTPSGGGSPRSWLWSRWVGFCPRGTWGRDGDHLASPSSQVGHGLEAGAESPGERQQLSSVSCWLTRRDGEGSRQMPRVGSDGHFSSKPSSCSLLCPVLFPAWLAFLFLCPQATGHWLGLCVNPCQKVTLCSVPPSDPVTGL